MSEAPHVYVVVPVHNRLRCLQDCLGDLARQDYPALTVVVVDDGSTDGTQEWLATWTGTALMVLRGDGSLWWGGAMRLGMEAVGRVASEGDYLLMLNDDVRVGPRFVSSLVAESRRLGDGVVGSVQRALHSDALLDCGYAIDYLRMLPMPIGSPAVRPNALSARGTLYPMRVVRRLGPLASRRFPHYFGDLEYSARAADAGVPLAVSAEAEVRTEQVSSDASVRRFGVVHVLFHRRSKSNVFHRAIFYSSRGPVWLRLWAVPRMLLLTTVRGVRRLVAPHRDA